MKAKAANIAVCDEICRPYQTGAVSGFWSGRRRTFNGGGSKQFIHQVFHFKSNLCIGKKQY